MAVPLTGRHARRARVGVLNPQPGGQPRLPLSCVLHPTQQYNLILQNLHLEPSEALLATEHCHAFGGRRLLEFRFGGADRDVWEDLIINATLTEPEFCEPARPLCTIIIIIAKRCSDTSGDLRAHLIGELLLFGLVLGGCQQVVGAPAGPDEREQRAEHEGQSHHHNAGAEA